MKNLRSYVSSHPFKVGLVAAFVLIPTVFVFQNCARLTYEDPQTANGILGSPTGGSNPLGGFVVKGVTGDVDNIMDNLLTGGKIPTFTWTESLNAIGYDVFVNQGSTIICEQRNVRALTVRLPSCVLNYANYDLLITSFNDTDRLDAAVFPFKVEEDLVELVIGTPKITGRQSIIPYTVKYPENVANLTCRLVDKKSNAQLYSANCTNVRQMTYNNMPYSDYIFVVDVTDKSGRKLTRQREFSILAPNCDPLSKDPVSDLCEKRLKANVYFHKSTDGSPRWLSSGQYVNEGILSGTIYLSQVFIPTRSFSTGFPGVSARTEFFGFDITTKIKPSVKMPAGNYQLAFLSDDGATLYSVDSAGKETVIIDNEGEHPTQLSCANKPFALAGPVNLRMTYFQGPRAAISFVMLYRPYSAMLGACSAPVTDNFFGTFPVPTNTTSWPGSDFQRLLDDGWKVVPADSFQNPDL